MAMARARARARARVGEDERLVGEHLVQVRVGVRAGVRVRVSGASASTLCRLGAVSCEGHIGIAAASKACCASTSSLPG